MGLEQKERKVKECVMITRYEDGGIEFEFSGINSLSQFAHLKNACEREILKRRAYGKPISPEQGA